MIAAQQSSNQIEEWLEDMGCHPKKVLVSNGNWQYEIDYPANTPHRMVVVNPAASPRAVIIGVKLAFSPEHIGAFGLLEDYDKRKFMEDLQATLNREFVEYTFDDGAPLTNLSCPTSFQITAIRYEDGLSLDSFARTVSSVYKTELSALLCVQQHLGGQDFPGPGGEFGFKVPRLQ
jgi:hypothetical protein